MEAPIKHWDDIASALESVLDSDEIPRGLRPMLVQAIAELRESQAKKSLHWHRRQARRQAQQRLEQGKHE